jgi:hypothetical protein
VSRDAGGRPAAYAAALILVVAAAASSLIALAARLLPAAHAATPSWTHWWCSAAALRANSSGSAHGGGLLASAAGLLPHWPHLLALGMAPATLLYLRRANARYHTERLTETTAAAPSADPRPLHLPADIVLTHQEGTAR